MIRGRFFYFTVSFLLSAIILCFAVTHTAGIAAPQYSALEPIGTVIAVEGTVYAIDKSNNRRALNRRSKIYLHDTLDTQTNGKAQIKLNDDSLISLQPSSKFAIDEFVFNKQKPQDNRYLGNIIKGSLISISGQGKKENYKLQSPLAGIVLRGTMVFSNLVSDKKTGVPTQHNIGCINGKCEVERLIGNRTKHLIGTDQPWNAVMVSREGEDMQPIDISFLMAAMPTVGGASTAEAPSHAAAGGTAETGAAATTSGATGPGISGEIIEASNPSLPTTSPEEELIQLTPPTTPGIPGIGDPCTIPGPGCAAGSFCNGSVCIPIVENPCAPGGIPIPGMLCNGGGGVCDATGTCVVVTPPPLSCLNGGVDIGGSCSCYGGWSGTNCETCLGACTVPPIEPTP